MSRRPVRPLIGIWTGSTALSLEAVRVQREMVSRLCGEIGQDHVWLREVVYRFGLVAFRSTSLSGDLDRRADETLSSDAEQFTPASQIKAILSFDYRDDVWTWPLTQLGIRGICIISDLLPFRSGGLASADDGFKALFRMASGAAAIVAPSRAFARVLERAVPAARGKVEVIYAGSDAIKSGPVTISELLASDEPASVATILMLDDGPLYKAHLLLAAAPKTARTLNHRRLRLILGSASNDLERYLAEHYASLLKQAHDVAEVVFAPVSGVDFGPLLDSADVVFQPESQDGFGLSLLQAMFAGKPAIGVNTESISELGGGHVVTCDVFDAERVAATISAVISSDDRATPSAVVRALRWAAERPWARAAASLQRVIEGEPCRSSAGDETCAPSDRLTDAGRRHVHDFDAGYVLDLQGFVDGADPFSTALLELVRSSGSDGKSDEVLVLVADARALDLDLVPIAETLAEISQVKPRIDVRLIFREPDGAALPGAAVRLLRDLIESPGGEGASTAHFRDAGTSRIKCGTIFVAHDRCLPDGVGEGVQTKRVIALRPTGRVKAPAEAIGDARLKDLIVASSRLQRQADHFLASVVRAGSLSAMLDQLERLLNSPDPSRPWARGPFDVLNDGLACLILPSCQPREGIEERDVAYPAGGGGFAVGVMPYGGRRGAGTLHDLRLATQGAVEALCFAAGCVIGRPLTDGRLSPLLLMAVRLGKQVVLIGDASHPLRDLFANIAFASSVDAALQLANEVIASEGGLPNGSRLSPSYPPGAKLVLSLLNLIETRGHLAVHDESELRQSIAVPDVERWMKGLARLPCFPGLREILASTPDWKQLIPKTSESARQPASIPAPDDDLASKLSACRGHEPWATVAGAWATGATEQVSRLQQESRIDLVVLCGEADDDLQIRCFDDFDAGFLDGLVLENISVLFAGGIGARPVEASRFFVTGPIVTDAPALAVGRFGLIPRLRPPLGFAKQERLAGRLGAARVVTFCPAEIWPSLARSWMSTSSDLVPFESTSELRALFASAVCREAQAGPERSGQADPGRSKTLRDFGDAPAISPALSYATSTLWTSSEKLDPGRRGSDRLALPNWRSLKVPSRWRRLLVRLPALSDPVNQEIGLCEGFYERESGPNGRSFRWLGPSPVGHVRLPMAASGPARLRLRISRLGECGQQDVAVRVQGRPVRLTWGRENDEFIAETAVFDLMRSRLIDIRITAGRMFRPGGADARRLHIAITELSLEFGASLAGPFRAVRSL